MFRRVVGPALVLPCWPDVLSPPARPAAAARARSSSPSTPSSTSRSASCGSDADVVDLTQPGVEPHDLDLRPRRSPTLLGRGSSSTRRPPAGRRRGGRPGGLGPRVRRAGDADLTLAAPAQGASARGGAKDPHFWLDPQLLAAVATAFGEPARRSSTRRTRPLPRQRAPRRASSPRSTPTIATAPRTCARRTIVVTSHAAFGYLGQRYGFTQVPIAGSHPDAEPSAQRPRPGRRHRPGRKDDDGVTPRRSSSRKLADTIARLDRRLTSRCWTRSRG